MSPSYSYHTSARRVPTKDERRLLEWLIADRSPDEPEYACQISQLRVVTRCLCGCPSVDFAIADYPRFGSTEMIARAEGHSPDGTPVWVTLYSRQGEISELEVYPLIRPAGVLGLPKPESLKILNRSTISERDRTNPSTSVA